jgi:hypothetical protein
MDHLSVFQMPTVMKITGRSSSITNAFISAIVPTILPTADDVKDALHILAMDPLKLQCSYCGDASSEWDHLRPLVMGKQPTGFISEIQNLVPACGKCNQSKGNKEWAVWMVSAARLSPKTRGVADLEVRVDRLRTYQTWREPTRIDFDAKIDPADWAKHWQNCERVQMLLKESQVLAEQIRRKASELKSGDTQQIQEQFL